MALSNTDETGIEAAVEQILIALGYDTGDQHFANTPARVAAFLYDNFRSNDDKKKWDAGFDELKHIFEAQFIEPGIDQLIAVTNVPFVSMCAHHMLPFTGTASIGYIPGRPDCNVLGVSKLVRVLHYFAKQLTIQERIGMEVANHMESFLKPLGVMVVLEAVHECMTCRGVEARGSSMITSVVTGVFRDNSVDTKQEFLSLIQRSRRD